MKLYSKALEVYSTQKGVILGENDFLHDNYLDVLCI